MSRSGAQQMKAWICPIVRQKLVIVLRALSLLFWHFINTTTYHFGRHKPISPSYKELHGHGSTLIGHQWLMKLQSSHNETIFHFAFNLSKLESVLCSKIIFCLLNYISLTSSKLFSICNYFIELLILRSPLS